MLWMKGWLETRWRLAFWFAAPVLIGVAGYLNHYTPPFTDRPSLSFNAMVLAISCASFGGNGVRSQAPIWFRSGLIGSAQFTLSLPVSRFRLFATRAGIGLFEISALNVILSWLFWFALPSAWVGVTPGDMLEYLLSAVVFLTGPYFVSVLVGVFLDEPFSYLCSMWMLALLLWLAHYLPVSVNIFRVWDLACPLITHRLPWSQMAVSIGLAAILFLAAFRATLTQED
jgi:hypothetical protein